MEELSGRLAREILVLDGAMGTMLMKYKFEEQDFRGNLFENHTVQLAGCNDVLCLTRPDSVYEIHKSYLEAGADIISSNTFNANRLSLAEYKLDSYVAEICRAGISIARRAVDHYCAQNNIPSSERPFVAGSMGPTGQSLTIASQSDNPACNFDDMSQAFEEQASALIDAGADILLLETIFDTLNARAAVYGVKKAFEKRGKELPVMISATIDEQGCLLSGQSLLTFVEAMELSGAISYGINCSFGAGKLSKYVKLLSECTSRYVSLHPNAGLPDAFGRYNDTPERMAAEMAAIMSGGYVNIVGGCCGTTPAHIRLIARAAKRMSPRIPAKAEDKTGDFIKVGERCNVAGSKKFLRLVKESDWNECLDIAAGQIDKGAGILDINMDDALLDAAGCMTTFIGRLSSDPRTSSVPLMIDSSDFNVVEQALRHLPVKGIVNSISLKNGKEEFIGRAKEIYRLGCSMVVMAFDEYGQADTFERRIEICSRAYEILTNEAQIPASSIIFDPNVLAVATGIESHACYAHDFIRTVEWIKRNLPGARVSGGISNLSFSFRGIDPVRKAMHSIFLEHCIGMGMDMAIINPATPLDSGWIDGKLRMLIDDVILYRHDDATPRLLDYATAVKARLDEQKAQKSASSKAGIPVSHKKEEISACNMVVRKLISGDSSSLEEAIMNACEECGGSALRVVNDVLIAGMDEVGKRFAAGEMFLPQVVRSAAMMKNAFDILVLALEEEQKSANNHNTPESKPLMVLATVKGDVHDIGKNIVAVVMRCSGFDVLDLGVMTPAEKIIDTAIAKGAAAVGLSGLITPSLHEMEIVAEMMEMRGMRIPLFVGGATTSELHTAVKLAPAYSGAVVHTADAASLPGAVSRFIGDVSGSEARENLKLRQTKLREDYAIRASLLSLEEARKRNAAVKSQAPTPHFIGMQTVRVAISDVYGLINWRAFLSEWGLDPSDAKLIKESKSEEIKNAESLRLYNDALTMLNGLNGEVTARIIIAEARGEGDNIIVSTAAQGDCCIPTLRSLLPNPVNGKCFAMSDFVNSSNDHIGIFCVTVAGSGIPEEIERLRNENEYQSLLLQSLSHRLVEASTEWMHKYAMEKMWEIPYPSGIRPAIGYGSLPDQSLVFLLDKFLDYSSLGVEVTDHGALSPTATTTGLIIGHPEARYFDVGILTEAAKTEYAGRRGLSPEVLKPYL